MIGYCGMGTTVAGGIETGIASTAIPIGAAFGPVGALVGAVVSLGAEIASAVGLGTGCGQPCIQATAVVNQAEVVLKANLAAYQNGQQDAATSIANFNQVWLSVQQACSGIAGAAGENCIKDRQRGGKWDWFALYLDPISNNAAAQTASTSMAATTTGTDFLSQYGLWIGAGLILIGLVGSR